ncbi:MAG: DsbA family protein [Planctomycetota bacterium]|nr:DsbA family protein [Planctomycetota bacterium]
MSGEAALRVPVHYDFASTICYVAHRVMERMAPTLQELAIELDWIPVDLTQITGYGRGAAMPELRRDNARRIGAELGVEVEPPPIWLDSRLLGAAALIARSRGRDAGWRERVWTALFEERREPPDLEGTVFMARDLALVLAPAEFEDASIDLDALTLAAVEAQVTGVPTFMLGRWPFGGIQSEETMTHVLERYARRARAGELS